MTSWSEAISLLNLPGSPERREEDDDFAAFLNIPFTFEEAGEPVEYGEEDYQRQQTYNELSKLLSGSNVDQLPKSATAGLNRIAATPMTALAQLAKRGKKAEIVPLVIPQPPPATTAQTPAANVPVFTGLEGLAPEVVALYSQLLANVNQPAQAQTPVGFPGAFPQFSQFNMSSGRSHDAIPLTPSSSSTMSPPPQSLLDPETDKRQRNNAASARFRAKKKLRDQALQHTALESVARLEMAERRCKEMELEIQWLRQIAAHQMAEKNGNAQDGRAPTLRELYEQNGVAWIEHSLATSTTLPAVSQASHMALTPLQSMHVPFGSNGAQSLQDVSLTQVNKSEMLDFLPALAALPASTQLPLSSQLKRQLVASQPRATKRSKLV